MKVSSSPMVYLFKLVLTFNAYMLFTKYIIDFVNILFYDGLD